MPKQLSPEEAEHLKQTMKEAFDKFDSDKSGQIDPKEFENVAKKFNETSKTKLSDAKLKETAAVCSMLYKGNIVIIIIIIIVIVVVVVVVAIIIIIFIIIIIVIIIIIIVVVVVIIVIIITFIIIII